MVLLTLSASGEQGRETVLVGQTKGNAVMTLLSSMVMGLKSVLRPLQCKIDSWGSEKEDLVRSRTGEGELPEVAAFDLGFEAQVGFEQAEIVGRVK